MTQKVLLIGLDGATFSILDPLMEQGVMPFLKQLIASGTSSELASVVPPLTPPAWTSLMTGRGPGSHGIFDFLSFEQSSGKRQLRVMDSDDVACETIWSMVARHNLKATVLNFPMTFPARAISGNVVPGWVPWRHLRLACYPKSLYEQLTTLPGFNPKELAMDMALEEKALEGCHKEEDYENWITLHIRRERQWFHVARHLMQHDPAQLTAVLFDGVDKLQHFCWRFLDPALLPASPSGWEQRVRALCLDYYREIDQFMAELVAMSGPEASVVVASDHGFGPTVEVFYLNAWLEQQGYLRWANTAQIEQKHPEMLGLGTMARRFYEIDWDKTTAYCPTPSSNGIYISPPTDDGKGVPADRYESFRRDLAEALLNFKDPATGTPVVTQIWTKEEAFAGARGTSAPDLTLMLRDGGLVSILPSEVLLKPRPEISGAHRPNGVFAAAGPGVRHGARIPSQSILDVAPLLLYQLGLPVPEDLEGKVNEALFEPAYLHSHAVRRGDSTQASLESLDAPPADPYMEAEVIKQLQALGYME